MAEFLLFALIVIGFLFGLPIIAWMSSLRTRAKLASLQALVEEQKEAIDRLSGRLGQLTRERAAAAPSSTAVASPAPSPDQALSSKAQVEPAPKVEPGPKLEPVPKPESAPKIDEIRPSPAHETAAPADRLPASPPERPVPRLPVPPPVAAVTPASEERQHPRVSAEAPPSAAEAPKRSTPGVASVPSCASEPPPPPRPPRPPQPPEPPAPAFDWEGLVGVKLFSAVAGIALVLAAVFFLRYSIEHGWLQPPVRVLIGVIVAVALLVVCELRAARQYPITANALDAAAIAILFATFFAAHALWDLIPALVTFALLALVTVVAVLLSIRRASLFIAVLGLLGGFATPALLSTGENRPIPLFAYLMLLNVGLAWVAYRQTWPVLTWLTLLLTTLYQWIWVFRFLEASSLPLAMAIFVAFPLAAVAGVLLARGRAETGRGFERTAMLSAALPLLFVVYLATVPAYGARAPLLFGFLLLLDIGLVAIAIGRRQELLHALGAVATMLVTAIWLSTSYSTAPERLTVLAFTAAFVSLYLGAPLVARRFGSPFEGPAAQAQYAAPMLLFVFPVLATIEPAFGQPLPLFATLVALLLVVAARSITADAGPLYYIAAFYAIAAQASWSATHLIAERLRTAVAIYSVFGVISICVPVVARRYYTALRPRWGAGAVLLMSLGLLLFLSFGPIAPAAIWALALLLAVLNAGLFIESAAGGLPLISQIGSLFSWAILASWWLEAGATIGVLPSLSVLTALALVTLGGHAWAHTTLRSLEGPPSGAAFSKGLYLGLIGHLFLVFIALNREWSVPPWPLFGAVAAMTLASSTVSLATGRSALHAAATIAAAVVIAAWAAAAGTAPWGLTAIVASMLMSAYAVAWMRIAKRFGSESSAAKAAGATIFIGELAVILAVAGGAAPPFAAVVFAHAVNLAALLALTWRQQWRHVAIAAVIPAWLGVLQWHTAPGAGNAWIRLLIVAGTLYSAFVGYPLVLGRRARADRDPYLAAVLASVMFFFAARNAFTAGGLDWIIGIVPVAVGAVLAVLLRELLRIEPAGDRDTGRMALVAGAALAFVTVAIPLQFQHQWITIGWALEGAALAWVYRRIPHRGLLYSALALLSIVFVRLALNPEILLYEPRGRLRIFNWYLYTYLISAAAFLIAAWWLSKSEDRIAAGLPRASQVLPAAGVILLFLLLNIEIADFYATGPTIAFRFGATVSQDLTYTIGWLSFGMILLAAGIYIHSRPARVAALALIAVTTFKCFLYDLGSLEGLYRVASFVGLACSLALVSIALQKYVLSRPKGTT